MAYDIEAIRKKLKSVGKFNDPDEFRPEKAISQTDPIIYRFFILPPIQKGDKIKSGIVAKSMEQFFIPHGNHWVQNKPYPCPRMWDNTECPVCTFGFELLKEKDAKEEAARNTIIKTWMPNGYNIVNIYFPPIKPNPESLHNTVKFYNAPKTCLDVWVATLMRNDAGDELKPEASGIFFDESAAYLFELQVLKQGKSNSYKTSQFLANNGKPTPMIRTSEGKANEKAIQALLAARHNLWDKVKEPNLAEIEKIFAVMSDGDDAVDNKTDGFDVDESDVDESDVKTSTTKATTESKTKKAKPDDDDDVISQLNAAANLDEEIPLDKKKAAVVKEEKKVDKKVEKTPEPELETKDEDDDDITSILSQLDD